MIHTFTRRLFCYYGEVLNCPAVRSPSQNVTNSSIEKNLTHMHIPLQLFAKFVAETVKRRLYCATDNQYMYKSQALRSSTTLGQIVSTASTASISAS